MYKAGTDIERMTFNEIMDVMNPLDLSKDPIIGFRNFLEEVVTLSSSSKISSTYFSPTSSVIKIMDGYKLGKVIEQNLSKLPRKDLVCVLNDLILTTSDTTQVFAYLKKRYS